MSAVVKALRQPVAVASVHNTPLRKSRYGTDPDKRLKIALGASLILHGIILSIQFGFPMVPRIFQDKPLEVVLVNSKTKERPRDAQAMAQNNLDGGGNTDENRRAKTPLPVSQQQREGAQLESSQQRVKELESQQRALLTMLTPSPNKQTVTTPKEIQPETPKEQSGLDLASSALAMVSPRLASRSLTSS